MNTSTQNSSLRPRRSGLRTATLFAALALVTIATFRSSAAAHPAPAATPMPTVITTIIPTSVEPSQGGNQTFETTGNVILRFQAPTLPVGVTVTKATLQLSCSNMKDSADGDTLVNLIYSDTIQPRFGSRNFDSDTPGAGNPMTWPTASKDVLAAFNGNAGKAFQLQLVPSGGARAWYSIAAESRLRPRLILEYTIPNRPSPLLTEGVPATHSPISFLPNPIVANQFTARDVSSIGSYTPVFYKGLVHLIRENQLQALPALGGPPVWFMPLAGAGQHLLLSETNRLYIVGSEKILVYQLQADPLKPPTVATGSGGQPLSPKAVPNLNPTIAPAVGPDGSLYFINGQEVYGLNPDLQELWKVTLDNTQTSRLTVGPTSQFVYLVGKKDRAMSLIAIDARTGEVFAPKLPNSDEPTSLHAPVVLLHQDGTEKIYVAANSGTSGALAAFDNPRTTVAGREMQVVATGGWNVLTGLVSQPTAVIGDTRKIYSVQVTKSNDQWKGQLKALDWLTGSPVLVGAEFQVGDESYLLNGGNLAVDQRGNIVVWNGADAKLYVFGSDASGLSPSPLAGLASRSRLFFGSDGTLYATDPTNTSATLRAIVPQYTLVDSSGADISSPTHLRVDGVANKDTKLSAPGNIILGNGFTVKGGKTLTIKQSGGQ